MNMTLRQFPLYLEMQIFLRIDFICPAKLHPGEGNGNPLQCSCLENPRDGEPGGLLSMGSHRVGHDWSDLANSTHTTMLSAPSSSPSSHNWASSSEMTGTQTNLAVPRPPVAWFVERKYICNVLLISWRLFILMNFPCGSDAKESTSNAGDLGSVPRWGRSSVRVHGYPFQNSCLENHMDRGAWRATIHGFATSQRQYPCALLPQFQGIIIFTDPINYSNISLPIPAMSLGVSSGCSLPPTSVQRDSLICGVGGFFFQVAEREMQDLVSHKATSRHQMIPITHPSSLLVEKVVPLRAVGFFSANQLWPSQSVKEILVAICFSRRYLGPYANLLPHTYLITSALGGGSLDQDSTYSVCPHSSHSCKTKSSENTMIL